MDNNETKKINIVGTNNRYQIKKLIQEKKEKKKRSEITNWNINVSDLTYQKQIDILKNLQCIDLFNNEKKLIKNQIERKINSYKHQDIERNILNSDKLISYDTVIEKLLECNLLCYYCNCEMLILYEIVRENSQWTLDRINNDIGHNYDNILISCLECNLKRRRQSKDKFLFTKQLKIYKNEEKCLDI
jgi:hypothetical protein